MMHVPHLADGHAFAFMILRFSDLRSPECHHASRSILLLHGL